MKLDSPIFIILEMASLDTLCVNRHFGVNSLYNLILLIRPRKTNFSVQNKCDTKNNNNNNRWCLNKNTGVEAL